MDIKKMLIPGEYDTSGTFGTQIHCPVCNFHCTHIIRPETIITDDYKAWEGRGSAIRVPMYCESGHAWEVRFGFHKGVTFIAIENEHKMSDEEHEKYL